VPPRLARYFEPTSATQELSRRLGEAGHRSYLVGGAVRDAFLDRVQPEADIDVATDARPEVIERVVKSWADAVWLQGERFGTVGAQKGEDRFEITTFRAEIYRSDSRKP